MTSPCEKCHYLRCQCKDDYQSNDAPVSIFLSWSGATAEKIAAAVRTSVLTIFGDVRVFFSHEDIAAGEQWLQKLQDELSRSEFGIIILTPASIRSRWVAMEFGALAKHFGSARIVPISVGLKVSEIPDPFNMFQAISFDELNSEAARSGFFHLMEGISKFLCRRGRVGQLNLRRVDEAWDNLRNRMRKILDSIQYPIAGDTTCALFHAYEGHTFQECFADCLSRTSTLRAASIGLAILYRSSLVREILLRRLCRRELEVQLTYTNPWFPDLNLALHPSVPNPAQSNTPDLTFTEPFKRFLDETIDHVARVMESEKASVGNDAGKSVPRMAELAFEYTKTRAELIALQKVPLQSLDQAESASIREFQVQGERVLESHKTLTERIKLLMEKRIKLKLQFSKLSFFHSVVCLDDDMFVFWYGHNVEMHREPVMHIRKEQGPIWAHFEAQLQQYETHLLSSGSDLCVLDCAETGDSDALRTRWNELKQSMRRMVQSTSIQAVPEQ